MEQITINKQTLPVKEYKGKRVVTFKEIDKVHSRADGTAHRNFKANRNRFIEGVDYFGRNSSEAKKEFGITAPNGIILITESGYLMLAKSFTDDLAWKVQRELVNGYFRAKTLSKTETVKPEQLTLETSEYFYFPKTFYGAPVVTPMDIEHLTGLKTHTVTWYLKRCGRRNKDYFIIDRQRLIDYKAENPSVTKLSACVFLITKSGCDLISKAYKCNAEMPKLIEEKKTEIQSHVQTNDPLEKHLIAMNVLMELKKIAIKFKNDFAEKNDSGMVKRSEESITAINKTMKELGMLITAEI